MGGNYTGTLVVSSTPVSHTTATDAVDVESSSVVHKSQTYRGIERYLQIISLF